MSWYHVVVAGSVLVAAFAQMALKKGASLPHRSIVREYLNPWVIGGYALMLCSVVIDVACIRCGVQVKEVSTIESLSYLFVPLLGFLFFGEKITLRKAGAIALILAGVVVFFV